NGQGSELTTATGALSLTILGFTPLAPGSRQADASKRQLDIVFSDVVPPEGSYDIPSFTQLHVIYSPGSPAIYGAMTGVVAISRITSDLADGTFSFVAPKVPDDPQPVTVTDGSF